MNYWTNEFLSLFSPSGNKTCIMFGNLQPLLQYLHRRNAIKRSYVRSMRAKRLWHCCRHPRRWWKPGTETIKTMSEFHFVKNQHHKFNKTFVN